MIDINYIEYKFWNYYQADINQTQEYVFSQLNEPFDFKTFW